MPPFLQATLRAFTPSAPRCSPTPHLPAPAHALSPLTPGPARPGGPAAARGPVEETPPTTTTTTSRPRRPGGRRAAEPCLRGARGTGRAPADRPPQDEVCVGGCLHTTKGPSRPRSPLPGPRPAPPRPLATSRRRRPPRRGRAGGGPFRFMSELGSARRKPGGHLGSSGSGGGAGGRRASGGHPASPAPPRPAGCRPSRSLGRAGRGGSGCEQRPGEAGTRRGKERGAPSAAGLR